MKNIIALTIALTLPLISNAGTGTMVAIEKVDNKDCFQSLMQKVTSSDEVKVYLDSYNLKMEIVRKRYEEQGATKELMNLNADLVSEDAVAFGKLSEFAKTICDSKLVH